MCRPWPPERRRADNRHPVRRAAMPGRRQVGQGEAMLTVRLLGRPGLSRDDRPLPPPRGRKAWALLGYLLLTGRPVARQRLAELFFADARDPLGALRWTLAELRRSLGVPTAL